LLGRLPRVSSTPISAVGLKCALPCVLTAAARLRFAHGVIPGSSHIKALGISSPGIDEARLMGPWPQVEHYVGLDVSLKLTAVCIVDQSGKIEREGTVASDPEAIASFVKSHAPDVARIGLEAGATSTWL